jgi:Na+-translocating ferredoxin:NAD+ oxidoreductase RnfD subunit
MAMSKARRRAVVKFFRTPKGLLTIVLAALVALAAPVEGVERVLPGVLAGALAAMAVDTPILRWRTGRWHVPSGALLTGLIVAMLLSPYEPWSVVAITAVVGVLSKYVVRTRSANVFNPAALGIVVTYHLFDTGQSWWGALPDLPAWTLAILLASGLFIADRVNKVPLVLTFLGVYWLCFTIMAFAGPPARVAEIYRAPDLQMALYFAIFILTDPPTSPVKHRDQVICGALVAGVSVVVFEWVGAAYYLLAGVLAGNVFEAWRRVEARKRKTSALPRGARASFGERAPSSTR